MNLSTKPPWGLEFLCEHWDSACENMPQEYVDKIVAMTMPKNHKPRNWVRALSGELMTTEEYLRYSKNTNDRPNRRPIYTFERFKREVLPEAVD